MAGLRKSQAFGLVVAVLLLGLAGASAEDPPILDDDVWSEQGPVIFGGDRIAEAINAWGEYLASLDTQHRFLSDDYWPVLLGNNSSQLITA